MTDPVDFDPLLEDEGDEEGADEEKLSPSDLEGVVQYTLDWSVASLLERIGSAFDVNPSFQRRDAWDQERKSRYIESLMLGLPVPQVALAEDPRQRGRFIVLDGKQRLLTLKQFAAPDADFPELRLRKLDFLPSLNGRSFKDLQGSLDAADYADSFLSQPVRCIVIRNWHQDAVLYQIFIRLNLGSLPLSPQELRQALFPGAFTSWINARSAKSDEIHRARRIKDEDFRMRDAEMLLRFVALSRRLEEYRGNLREFLDEACRVGNSDYADQENVYSDLAARCELAIVKTESIFGTGNAFLRYGDGRYVRRFNIAVFDAMSLVLSDPMVTVEAVDSHATELREAFEKLCMTDDMFQDYLVTTTKSIAATFGRVSKWSAAVEKVLGVRTNIERRATAALAANGDNH